MSSVDACRCHAEYWWNIGGIIIVLHLADKNIGGIIVLHLPDKNIGGIIVLHRTFMSSVDSRRCHACTCL